jgi:predicted DNA-binding WGR domain protein
LFPGWLPRRRTAAVADAGTSNKFWEVWVEGNNCVTRWGKIGTEGRETIKECKAHAAAQAEMTKKGNHEKWVRG